MDYETKDSGERVEYASGMTRDIQDGKPDFSLLLLHDITKVRKTDITYILNALPHLKDYVK